MNAPLESLYPELRARPPITDEALLHSLESKASDSVQTKALFFSNQGSELVSMARSLAASFRDGGRLFTMGNGGSATDAGHVAVEFNHPVTAGRPALPAIHLGSDVAFLTALANDVGFEHAFARQLMALGRSGDAVLGLSTSGNSKNLLRSFSAGKQRGLRTMALTGGDGGQMKTSPDVDHCIVVDSSSIHRIQECHVAAYHILWDLVHTLLAQDRGRFTAGAGAGKTER
ncbi:MAG: SIS domain-containing protein [Myxococcota bacterium]